MNGNDKFMQNQPQAKQTSESDLDYIEDIGKWTSEINQRDHEVKLAKEVNSPNK